ncbi:alpha/beta fold hydrolase [Bosea rubneri]|uniref:Alpha/beta fold hydrolase n=1 Tax=Bosea rubneri TaxID=3075434 RepID=A0ABU3SDG2_9HYPH|nr:alpha/beta fold hydrolase [Bosea sp. ZW T0_25]MDU0342809.1 alpha/beta fold hydrolase [Bosea sp. ZW T0_25]
MPSAALSVIRPLVRIGSFIAPRTAGRAAFKLFCTPPRLPGPQSRTGKAIIAARARLAPAIRQAVSYPCGTVSTYLFEPEPRLQDGDGPAPTVILLHGWNSEAAFMTAFVAPLLAQGFRVVAFDMPAHGASTGAELNIPLGVAALAAVARVFAPVHAVVTHSFGGAIALAALAGSVPGQPSVEARRLALIAAPSSIAMITRNFGATIGLGRRGQAALEKRIHSVAGNPIEVFEGREQLAAISLPTLVIHDRQDRELDFHHAEALAAAGPFVTLEETGGLGHRRILQAKPVVESVTRFVVG